MVSSTWTELILQNDSKRWYLRCGQNDFQRKICPRCRVLVLHEDILYFVLSIFFNNFLILVFLCVVFLYFVFHKQTDLGR